MHAVGRIERLLRRVGRDRTPIWYDPAYRLPVAAFGAAGGIEPRRADFVAWYLLESAGVSVDDFRLPVPIGWGELARVHTRRLLASLHEAATLARIFAVDPAEVAVDGALETIRMACGATLAAAREALARRGPALNLLGGFHHAAPDRAGALCPVNDLAVAVAALRAGGFSGRVLVIDVDAHPPDGTAECLAGDPDSWIGSLSASDWGPMPRVDEQLLPVGCDSERYLDALDALLGRMPTGQLALVIAGGDVLAGDPLGRLGLDLAGARARDLRILRALGSTPSVWLPGGGYHADAWKVLAGTALALRRRSRAPVGVVDPMAAHFDRVRARLRREELAETELDLSGVLEDLAGPRHEVRRRGQLLGLWTAAGIEYALHEYGILEHVGRLGYRDLHVSVDRATAGDRFQLHAREGAIDQLLAEAIVDRGRVADHEVLWVNWLTLRHPHAAGGADFVPLPGQEVPGLGLARESAELLLGMARRLGLAGVAFRPAYYHVAWAARDRFRFFDPERHGRFEALVRDLGGRPLPAAATAVAEGRVTMNGEPYAWEASDMVFGIDPEPGWTERVAAERERLRFAATG